MLNLNAENWEFHDPPPSEATLWRYMDFTKFVSLLENSALFFARADKLDDPFEGALPITNIASWYMGLTDKEASMYQTVGVELRRFTLISCWHESVHESDAMWKIYSSANSGIAIKTTRAAFVESFSIDEQMHLGRVRYIDYNSEQIPGPEDDWLSPYFHKRSSFAHEREVRAIIQHVPNEAHPDNFLDLLMGARPPIWPDRYDFGVNYEVDLNQLIQEVVVDPSAPDWFLYLVHLVTTRYDLQVPIRRSDLAAVPEQFLL